MELLPNIHNEQTALFLQKSKTLVIADIHLGLEESLVKKGQLIPRQQKETLFKQIHSLLKLNPKKVILNGDIKHTFGTILETEWRDTLQLFDLLKEKLILIQGNHDTILNPILKKRKLVAKKFYEIDDCFITHGDTIYPTAAKTIIIGHEHPSITLKDGLRSETYKCFLVGKFEKQNLIVMPSCNTITIGSEEPLGPYRKKAKNLKTYIVENNTTYYFGPMTSLPSH